MSDTRVPEGCEIVGYGVNRMRGAHFPVAGEGRLDVGNVEEMIWMKE